MARTTQLTRKLKIAHAPTTKKMVKAARGGAPLKINLRRMKAASFYDSPKKSKRRYRAHNRTIKNRK